MKDFTELLQLFDIMPLSFELKIRVDHLSKNRYFSKLFIMQEIFMSSKKYQNSFSPQQKQILKYLIAGLDNRKIVAKTGLSETELKTELQKIYDCLGVKTRVAAVIKAEKMS